MICEPTLTSPTPAPPATALKTKNPFDESPLSTPKSSPTPNEAILEHHDSFSRRLSPIKTKSIKHQMSDTSQGGAEAETSDRAIQDKVLEKLASGKGEKDIETPKHVQNPKDVEQQKPQLE